MDSRPPQVTRSLVSAARKGFEPCADWQQHCVSSSQTLCLTGLQPASPAVDAEQALKTFDLTSKFGPCIGITRLERCGPARLAVTTELQTLTAVGLAAAAASRRPMHCRWERSQKFGLDPPPQIKLLIEQGPEALNQPVWAGKV